MSLINHPMFPKNHVKISRKEFEEECPINIAEIPKIYTHDLGARYSRATLGDIVKITRSDGSVYYREVVVEEKIWRAYLRKNF